MTKKELMEKGKELGLDLPEEMKNADMEKAIEEAEQKAALEADDEKDKEEKAKVTTGETTQVKVGDTDVLVMRAKQPMTVRAFKAASEMLKHEEEATGVKIILMPYSAELDE